MTFLFTDIEGSTDLLQRVGTDVFDRILTEHARIMRAALCEGTRGGREVRVEGDSFFVVFASAEGAAAAAAQAQRELGRAAFAGGAVVRVRMGLHTGEGRPAAAEAGADYVGIAVHRAARIAASAHGGQVILSESTRSLVEKALPAGVTLRDLGSHRFKDFAEPERIQQLVIDGLPSEFPPLRTLDRANNNLPAQLTSFIGREREVAEAARLLGDGARLLTLTGPGGTGKTRLSLEVASELLDRFPDGVYWVALAPIADAALVAPAIATSLGLQDSGAVPVAERVREHLREKAVLLVIDNFEQVLGAASVVGDILRAAPKVRAIVSSRAPLRVAGEHEFPVPPLTLPEAAFGPEALAQSEAARLFVERASAVDPHFAVTAANAAAIAEIVRRVDGLPLAIELAAARVKVLTPEAIAQRLGRTLDMLSAGGRDVPDRQRTLRGAITWSYDLLDAPARLLFERIAVFIDGADLDDVEVVCAPDLGADVLDVLMGLVDHSLVRRRDAGATPRFRMLVTIREFALERLEASGAASEVRRRHAERYLAVFEGHAPRLFGPQQRETLDRMERDQANLHEAVESAVASDAPLAHRLLCASWRFWQMRGHLQEARALADRVLATSGVDPSVRAKAVEAAAGVAYWQGDVPAAQRWYLEALEHWRGAGDERELANALYNVSFAYALATKDRRDMSAAERSLGEALAIYERLGDARGKANVLFALVNTHGVMHRYDDARRSAALAVATFRELGDPFMLGWSLHMAGLGAIYGRDRAEAGAAATEALRIFRDVGDISAVTLLLTDFALLASWDGDVERAVRLVGAADRLQELSGAALVNNAVEFVTWQDLPVAYPDEALKAAHRPAYDEGRAMDLDAAVAYALGTSGPA